MVRFLPFPRSDGIHARDSRETRGMRRSRFYICFSFFPQRLWEIALARFRERNFFVRAKEESGESFLRRLGANDARAIFEKICVSWIFVRANASSCAREERWFLRVYSTKGSERGSRRARFFIFFSSSLFSLHSLFAKLFLPFSQKTPQTAIAKDV